MNTKQIKNYASEARRDFIAAVTDRAALYGLSAEEPLPVTLEGDVAIIGGKAFSKADVDKRARLADRVRRDGFEQVMEAMAYTWFNRLMAIRYMELHGYLEHGYRVLSHPEGKAVPEILGHATEVELPGVDHAEVVELKLDGTRDEELYRLLLLGQCHALYKAMPFLFESLNDETELLLPSRLLHTDSLVRKLVERIEEGAWESIEIVGWLYQFYISEKKAQVIGKVVKSEDIPAATQLFTPNWIVKYMVQNSLGAQWLETYPNSPLKEQMEFYIEPTEQTDEVKAQRTAITPSTLNPEELTLIDPASGSGHILVEAYELFKALYLERGYRQRDVAQLILQKNLFGLDIDGRAAQLTGFVLMMKGRADDRRLFERNVRLNVMALMDSFEFDAVRLAKGVELAGYRLQPESLTELQRLFKHAQTFGSLLRVPEWLVPKLPTLMKLCDTTSEDLFVSGALKHLERLGQQAQLLATRYDAVVANPPYMSSSAMNASMKKFAKDRYPDAKRDLFACFIERGYELAKNGGHAAMVTMQSWVFLSSFEKMRKRMLREKTICTMAHLGARAFGSLSGEVVQTTAFVLQNRPPQGCTGARFLGQLFGCIHAASASPA
ncbi:MAG: BREX-1 system adenine-specific DNA-methyltransferase PglX [bacterium]|nr:BREX-1 system adenine-specific DNA-methyltransferase PglX [bacterium]